MIRSKISLPPSPPTRTAADAPAHFAIKTAIAAPQADDFRFVAQKTMYGGRRIAEGDTIFLFASENDGGSGLIARGVVTGASSVPRQPGRTRQTPRVTIEVLRTATALRIIGRRELRPFDDWNDGRPETELNFKFYRQATDKIVGLSGQAARFLDDACKAVRSTEPSDGSRADARRGRARRT